ncbi:hypothetical protein XA68_17881 [Ophiocordyceps unilateralis]|uniref:Uncharacterized protein n=1 Tax=Ophiocordyceps unilateralis TaxID=268505 RepID=A0A2A9PK29_OPHUN|nr:hypothetical protein XA68_17881 [Ophiocordyceps unilateralis]
MVLRGQAPEDPTRCIPPPPLQRMLPIASARRVRQGGARGRSSLAAWYRVACGPVPWRQPASVSFGQLQHGVSVRSFGSSKNLQRPKESDDDDARRAREMERVVRETAQRFRGTLPKGYLTDEEYALYERLYGPPQRETEPEDVGIPTHADLGSWESSVEETEGKEVESDESDPQNPINEALEENQVDGTIPQTTSSKAAQDPIDDLTTMSETEVIEQTADSYVNAVARNEREHRALLKLAEDFKATRRELQRKAEEQQKEMKRALKEKEEAALKNEFALREEELALRELWEEELYKARRKEVKKSDTRKEDRKSMTQEENRKSMTQEENRKSMTQEEAETDDTQEEADTNDTQDEAETNTTKEEAELDRKLKRLRNRPRRLLMQQLIVQEDEREEPLHRYHPWTLLGRFHERPLAIEMPLQQLGGPIRTMLARTHIDHIRQAARLLFSASDYSNSAGTIVGPKGGPMEGVLLTADQRSMSNIEADTFLAVQLPPLYASVMSVLREVRRRVGTEWLQSRLKQGESGALRILDAGAGGAALVAWDQIVQAEWEVLLEKKEVRNRYPAPSQKTALIAADRLRERVKYFLPDTTFLTRLPDYLHSGETKGEHLEAGKERQSRKQYDIVVASHLLLKEEAGHNRQELLEKLWSLVRSDGGILVILERGHPRGFEAMAHARDTVLNKFLLPHPGFPLLDIDESKRDGKPKDDKREPGHIIAPCPTQGTCPMYKTAGLALGRKDFCHFDQKFMEPSYYRSVLTGRGKNHGRVEFSYVAIRRGVGLGASVSGRQATRDAFDSYEDARSAPDMRLLPRQILRPLKKRRHVILDMCTPDGGLERWTVPKSYGKLAYHDARKTKWGDLWALGAKTRVMRHIRSGLVEESNKMRDRFRRELRKQIEKKRPGGGQEGDGKPVSKKLSKAQKKLKQQEARRKRKLRKLKLKERAEEAARKGIGKATDD